MAKNFRVINIFACHRVTWSNITKVKLKETFREGRATLIFKIFDGKLLAIHSHFSEYVNPADNSL